MRTRTLIGILALTAATGVATVGALERVPPSEEAIPSVDEPAHPDLPEVKVPEEGIQLSPLEPKQAPYPRFEAREATLRFAGREARGC